jgi:hypothetical protein
MIVLPIERRQSVVVREYQAAYSVYDDIETTNLCLIKPVRENTLANSILQARFKLQTPLAVEQQVLSQSRPIFTKALISGIVPHGFEPVPDRREEAVKVRFVFPVLELATWIMDLVPAGVAVGFEDKASMEEDLHKKR